MTKITLQDNELTISFDFQGEPTQKEIVEAAIFVLERALGEESVQKHLKDYVSEERNKSILKASPILQPPLWWLFSFAPRRNYYYFC